MASHNQNTESNEKGPNERGEKTEEELYADIELPMPFGLEKSSLAPSARETLANVDLEALNTRNKKTPYQRHLEELKAKEEKRQAEVDAIYNDFVSSFQEEALKKKTDVKTFVRGETVFGESVIEEPAAKDSSKLYRPTPRWVSEEEEESARRKSQPTENRKNNNNNNNHSNQEPGKKRRAIDELREELDSDELMGRGSQNQVLSSNIHIANLPPEVDEKALYSIFSRFGAIASVKIMWPRSEAERLKNKNGGFVCFVNRSDASQALRDLKGLSLMGREIEMSWGRAVSLPPTAPDPTQQGNEYRPICPRDYPWLH
jgi:U2-associated protein SR140